jgi:SAM-dependent methyltransferase
MHIYTHPLTKFYRTMPNGIKLLDVGALNFTQWKRLKDTHPDIKHYGIDYCDPSEEIPSGYIFKNADLNKAPIPFEDDMFDIVIATHIIEHLDDPINFYSECIRVLKPGGIFYLEAPSEKSLKFSGMSFDYDKFFSLSLYDDPTHTKRPWTPQSYYRLTKYYSCNPIKVGYIRSGIVRLLSPLLIPYAWLTRNGRLLEKSIWLTYGWASYLFAEKPRDLKGTPPFFYYIPDRKKK